MDKLLYRPNEAQEALGLSRSKFFDFVRQGLIVTKKLDGCTFVAVSELKRFAESVPNKAA